MNTEIEKLFVPYEIAFKLKELGFKESCLGYYIIFSKKDIKKTVTFCDMQRDKSGTKFLVGIKTGDFIAAPTNEQVLEWMKTKHNIFIEPFTSFRSPKKNVTIFRVQKYGKVYRDITAKTLKEAIEVAIKLIK